jgi:hypothetical protein
MTNREALQLLHITQRTVLFMAQQLDILELKEKHVALDPTVAKAIAALDTATTAVANRLQKLVDQANQQGSVSAAEIVAALQPEINRLTDLGADQANPVPPEPPTPPVG